jgi:uncharacterized protein (DUF2141 family)
MKNFKYVLFWTLIFFAPLSFAAKSLATLQVQVSNISDNQGVVRIALYNNPEAFSEKNDASPHAFKRGIASINQRNQAVYTFKNVPYGTYAIKLFHDENNSGQFKKNIFGKPQEGFGFSNNPPIKGQAPSFGQSKFIVNKAKMMVNIKMVNPS